jgi:WD40 repeat protein
MRTMTLACLLVYLALARATAQAPTPPVVEIPAERFDFNLGDPLSGRALVARPLPITGVLSWSLETRRHRGAIWCSALSRDGRLLATGGLDGSIRLWDLETGKLVRALIGHNSYVTSLDWSPDGNTLASAGAYDYTVRLWDGRSGRPLRVLKGHSREAALVKWSPDGRTVVTCGGTSGVLTTWNAVSGVKRDTLELGTTIGALAWRHDGGLLAVVCATASVQLWDPDKNKVARTVGTAKDNYVSIAWAPDGKRLAAGTARETRVYDDAFKLAQTIATPAAALAWSDDGSRLATLYQDSIKVWDAASPELKSTISVSAPRSFAAAGDLSLFVSTTSTGFAVHEGGSARTLRQFDNLSGTTPPLWWSSKTIVTGTGTPDLKLWDFDTGKLARRLEGHKGAVAAVSVSPGGKLLASAGHDQTVCLWDHPGGKLLHSLSGHSGAVLGLAFSSDGKLLATGGADKQVLVWEAASGKLLHTLADCAGPVSALAWKPGAAGVLLANSKPGSVQTWNVKTGKVEQTLEGSHDVVSLAWSPDGSRVTAGQANGLTVLWQLPAGKLLHTLEAPGSPPAVTALAWAPKAGQWLAAGRANHTLQLWDPKTGKRAVSLPTMAPVERVSWSAAGSTIGVSSQDRTARFFDAATHKLRGVLLAEDEQLIAINFDGHYRAPAAEDELVYVVQTRTSQDTYTPSQFATKYILKNAPTKVSLVGN